MIERALSEGNDVYQLYKGLVSILRSMLITKVCGGAPPFLYLGEEERKNILELSENLEYYEIQNMLHYMLKAEDLLKGVFPRISLEILYINLYNLLKLRDVEKVMDSLGRQGAEGQAAIAPRQERPVARPETEPPARPVVAEPPARPESPPVAPVVRDYGEPPEREPAHVSPPAAEVHAVAPRRMDAAGFVEFLRGRKPLVGSIIGNLNVRMDDKCYYIYVDRKSASIMDDSSQKEEIKELLKEFFGKELGLAFKEGTEVEKEYPRGFCAGSGKHIQYIREGTCLSSWDSF